MGAETGKKQGRPWQPIKQRLYQNLAAGQERLYNVSGVGLTKGSIRGAITVPTAGGAALCT